MNSANLYIVDDLHRPNYRFLSNHGTYAASIAKISLYNPKSLTINLLVAASPAPFYYSFSKLMCVPATTLLEQHAAHLLPMFSEKDDGLSDDKNLYRLRELDQTSDKKINEQGVRIEKRKEDKDDAALSM